MERLRNLCSLKGKLLVRLTELPTKINCTHESRGVREEGTVPNLNQ